MIITLDGPAGSGKSTVALRLALALDLPYLNSGAIYRAVTLAVLESGGCFDDPEAVARSVDALGFQVRYRDGVPRYFLGERDATERLKDPDLTAEVYRIANVPRYRALLVEMQRRFGSQSGVVAEGRDMGTVIFPEAALKVFLDAPAEVRARRQYVELLDRGIAVVYDELLARVRERDHRDRSRSAAPLAAAPDAVVVESGGLSVREVVDRVLLLLRERCREGASCRYGGILAAAGAGRAAGR